MNKSLKYSSVIFTLTIIITIIYGNSFFENKSSSVNYLFRKIKPVQKISDVIYEKKLNSTFEKIYLFKTNKKNAFSFGLDRYITNTSLLKIQKNILADLLSRNPQNITLEIPLADNSTLELELTKQKIFSDNFKAYAISQNGKVQFNYSPGIYYSGIVKGKMNSIASVSIFKENIIGIVSDEAGNYNLGSIMDNNKITDNYVYYPENDLLIKNKFKCAVDNYNKKLTLPVNNHKGNFNINDARLPVNISFVADYKMFQDNNSDTNAVGNFISGFFNSVHTIYQNEFLPIQISEIAIYTFPDPYRNINNPFYILTAFGGNTQIDFNGNLAHLLSTRSGDMGGISWIRTLGAHYNNADSSGPYSFSNIENHYLNFPVYSWTVTVVAHEMGHSFGSQHTHACAWPVYSPYVEQAIDSCYYSEGGCFNNYQINNNGTIMSYCHLLGAINFNNGFGPMPGDTIRLRYNQDPEFGPVENSSEQPAEFYLLQNYPNPFNPSTNISFAVPDDAYVTMKVYDIGGRELATLASNNFYTRGLYNIYFSSQKYMLSSGIYFYKIVAYGSASPNHLIYTNVKKMILTK